MRNNIVYSNMALPLGLTIAMLFYLYPLTVSAQNIGIEKPAAQLLQEIVTRANFLQSEGQYSGGARSTNSTGASVNMAAPGAGDSGVKPPRGTDSTGTSVNMGAPGAGDNVKAPSLFAPADNSNRMGVSPGLLQDLNKVLDNLKSAGNMPQSGSVIMPNSAGGSGGPGYGGPTSVNIEYKAPVVTNAISNSNTTDLAAIRSLLEEVLKRLIQLTSQ